MSWYLSVLKKYAVFNGRARRKEYWMFFLFNIIFMLCAVALDHIFGTNNIDGSDYGVIEIIYMLAVMLPCLGVAIRRLHDLGKSGWYVLVNLIPLAGSIWFLILMCRDGIPGNNIYGPNPKEIALSF